MGKFIIQKTPTGKYNFSLIANNYEKIAVASQIYATKQSCKTGIDSVIKNAVKCIEENRIEDSTLTEKNKEPKTNPKFEIYLDKAGLYRYRLFASNGESIAMSEEGYKTKDGCKNGLKSVAAHAPIAEIVDDTQEKV